MAVDVAATGADLLPWRTAPNRPNRRREHAFRDWDTRNPMRLARDMAEQMLAGPAPGYAADVTAAVDAERPDLVVTSFTALGAMIAAEARGLPFDVLIPNIYPMPAAGIPPMGMGLRPATGPLGGLRDRLANRLSTRVIERFALPGLNATRSAYGLKPVSQIWDQVHHARRELVLTSGAFDFPGTFRDNTRYVGPVLDDPEWANEPDWPRPADDAPLVLVAMSSTFQDQTAVLQRILDALAELPVRGLLTTGPALDPEELHAPPNVTIVDSAPHHLVLREAALVVTHGGHGTVVKTLAAGLPLLILPHGRDQPDNAVRVTSRGAGLALPRTAGTKRIRTAVHRLLDNPEYAAAAAKIGAAIGEDADSGQIVTELETIG